MVISIQELRKMQEAEECRQIVRGMLGRHGAKAIMENDAGYYGPVKAPQSRGVLKFMDFLYDD